MDRGHRATPLEWTVPTRPVDLQFLFETARLLTLYAADAQLGRIEGERNRAVEGDCVVGGFDDGPGRVAYPPRRRAPGSVLADPRQVRFPGDAADDLPVRAGPCPRRPGRILSSVPRMSSAPSGAWKGRASGGAVVSSPAAACGQVHGRYTLERLREGIQAADHLDRVTSQASDGWPAIVGAAAGRDPGETIASDSRPVLLRGQQPEGHPLQQTAAGQVV